MMKGPLGDISKEKNQSGASVDGKGRVHRVTLKVVPPQSMVTGWNNIVASPTAFQIRWVLNTNFCLVGKIKGL